MRLKEGDAGSVGPALHNSSITPGRWTPGIRGSRHTATARGSMKKTRASKENGGRPSRAPSHRKIATREVQPYDLPTFNLNPVAPSKRLATRKRSRKEAVSQKTRVESTSFSTITPGRWTPRIRRSRRTATARGSWRAITRKVQFT